MYTIRTTAAGGIPAITANGPTLLRALANWRKQNHQHRQGAQVPYPGASKVAQAQWSGITRLAPIATIVGLHSCASIWGCAVCVTGPNGLPVHG